MSDLQTTTLLVGLSVALARAVEYLAKALLKKPETQNGHSGTKTVDFWENKIGHIVDESIGQAFRGRNEQVRSVFSEVNKPIYDKLDKMLENQEKVVEKLNELIIEVIKGKA